MNKLKVNAMEQILEEFRKAEKKHQSWPKDFIHQSGIVIEEATEVVEELHLLATKTMQTAIDLEYKNPKADLKKFKKEVAQTGAMAFRILFYLEDKEEQ